MTLNPYDLKEIQGMISEHKGEKAVYSGLNAKGETCIIYPLEDRVMIHVQKWSGYILSVTYWPNGEREEEWTGSWLKHRDPR